MLNQLEEELRKRDDAEVTQQKKQEEKDNFSHRILPHRGHSLFEINLKKGTVELAKYEGALEIDFNGGKERNVNRKVIIMDQDCVYISALNKKNAVKHFKKKSNGSKIMNF
jgi:hypothetical protein